MSIQSVTYPRYYSDQWQYSINAHHTARKIKLVMQAPESFITTTHLPKTAQILSVIAPRVLNSKCFNNSNIPFHEEVKHTEIAHLYEHMLLEVLCQERIGSGSKNACYSGWTTWDWKKNARGIFEVEITGNSIKEEKFVRAFSRSIMLFETILAKHEKINPKQIDLDYLFVKKMHE